MIKKCFLKTLLILSLSTALILTLPGNGICLDKTKIDLSEYRGIGSRTFIAYKYAFGVRTVGTLQYVVTPTETGFILGWSEEYPFPDGDGTALYLEYAYDDTAEGSFEKNISRYGVSYLEEGIPTRGDLEYRAAYREPWGTQGQDGAQGKLDPLLTFPYALVDIGYMWGDAFVEKGSHQDIYFPRVYQFAVLGLEDVTVPAGSFTECIKIARFRGNQADRITWYAKGIGPVKMIYAQEEHSHFILDTQLNVQGYNRAFVLESLAN